MNFDLDLPDWLPKPIACMAKLIHANIKETENSTEAIALLRRLTSDPRMGQVWKELYKKNDRHTKPQVITIILRITIRQAEQHIIESTPQNFVKKAV